MSNQSLRDWIIGLIAMGVFVYIGKDTFIDPPGSYQKPLRVPVAEVAAAPGEFKGKFVTTEGQLEHVSSRAWHLETEPKTRCDPSAEMCLLRVGGVPVWWDCSDVGVLESKTGGAVRVMGMVAKVRHSLDWTEPSSLAPRPALVAYEIQTLGR